MSDDCGVYVPFDEPVDASNRIIRQLRAEVERLKLWIDELIQASLDDEKYNLLLDERDKLRTEVERLQSQLSALWEWKQKQPPDERE